MVAYEFSAQMNDTSQVVIPDPIAQAIPSGASVRVLILLNEHTSSTNGEGNAKSFLPSLDELMAEVKRNPSKPEQIHPGDGLLAWRLSHPLTEPNPNFDEAAWNQEWAQIEAEMKAASLAHEQEELRNFMP